MARGGWGGKRSVSDLAQVAEGEPVRIAAGDCSQVFPCQWRHANGDTQGQSARCHIGMLQGRDVSPVAGAIVSQLRAC